MTIFTTDYQGMYQNMEHILNKVMPAIFDKLELHDYAATFRYLNLYERQIYINSKDVISHLASACVAVGDKFYDEKFLETAGNAYAAIYDLIDLAHGEFDSPGEAMMYINTAYKACSKALNCNVEEVKNL